MFPFNTVAKCVQLSDSFGRAWLSVEHARTPRKPLPALFVPLEPNKTRTIRTGRRCEGAKRRTDSDKAG
jgi:hypothetical protein